MIPQELLDHFDEHPDAVPPSGDESSEQWQAACEDGYEGDWPSDLSGVNDFFIAFGDD